MRLTRTVTVDQPVSHEIAALVHFVRCLETMGKITFTQSFTDEQLIEMANSFWDSQHGEDD